MVEFWCLDPPLSEQILLYRYLRYNCYLVREISIECQEYSCVTLGKKYISVHCDGLEDLHHCSPCDVVTRGG